MSRTVSRVVVSATVLCVLAFQGAFGENSHDQKLWRLRNVGAAYYENQDYDQALSVLQQCVELAPESAADLVNLGLVHFRKNEDNKAIAVFDQALRIDSTFPHCYYATGLIYKRDNKFEEAIVEFNKVTALDPGDAPSHYNLGVMYQRLGRDEEAIRAFQATVRHNPDHPSAHYYLYKFAKAARRSDEARRELKIFKTLQKSISDRKRTEAAFEEGPYLKMIVPPSQSFAPLESGPRTAISFHDISETAQLPARTDAASDQAKATALLADPDKDGDLDIYIVRDGSDPAKAGNQLLLNEGSAVFRDVTATSGTGDQGAGTGACMADFDNDGFTDIYVLNRGANVLLRNGGDGTFSDVTASTGVGDAGHGRDAAFFDYDHDGDLDLFVANYTDTAAEASGKPPGRGIVLYRYNGDSTFSLLAANPWEDPGPRLPTAFDFADCDDDEDTDLLTTADDSPPVLFLNKKRSEFASGDSLGETVATHARFGDFDNDGKLDAVVINDDGARLYHNEKAASFSARELPAFSSFVAARKITAMALLDFDNDGLVDVLLAGDDGRLGLFANDGSGAFSIFSDDLAASNPPGATVSSLDAGDVDGDGDLDILGVWSPGTPFLLENRGGNAANWLEVELVGERVPIEGIGAKVELKTGPFYQRKDVTRGRLHLGLGTVDHVEVLRITWTNGIVQNMLEAPLNERYEVAEIVRADASCPFLFAYDGTTFNYVNDILGVAAMGVPFDETVYHIPDPDENVKIDGDRLAPFDQSYHLRLAAELKETVYLDQVRLLVIDHPADVDVYPNERFSEPPFMEPGLHIVKERRHPVAAIDQDGHDVRASILARDLSYPSNIPMTAYDGLAEHHWIECDLGDLSGSDGVMLYLTGWIYWASASANVAISQNDKVVFEAVSLLVPDCHGNWTTAVADIGLPNGKNSTIPIDLTGVFRCDDYRIRLATNLVVYWDEVFFAVDETPAEVVQQEAGLVEADLYYRGFSEMKKDSLGMEFFDYEQVQRYGCWRQQTGLYTRYGLVTELVGEINDRYAVFGPGEEVSLVFDASRLTPLPSGWSRDFFFYAFGWIKDGDPNTKYSGTVEPLPFRGMPGYPYEPTPHPKAEEVAHNLSDHRTRPATQTVERLQGWGR